MVYSISIFCILYNPGQIANHTNDEFKCHTDKPVWPVAFSEHHHEEQHSGNAFMVQTSSKAHNASSSYHYYYIVFQM